MASATLLPNPRSVFYDANGNPLAGGFVNTYVPNTITPKTTWQDSGQATPNANPIVLDAAGSALIYGSGSYTFAVTDSLGNAIPAYSGLTTASLSQATFATIAALRLNATAAVSPLNVYVVGYTTPADGGEGTFVYNPNDSSSSDNGGTIIVDALSQRWYRQYETLSLSMFGVDLTGGTDEAATIRTVFSSLGALGGTVIWPPGTIDISSTVTITNPILNIGNGSDSTTIITNNATADIFSIVSDGVTFKQLGWAASVTRTAGAFVNWGSVVANVLLRDFQMVGQYVGVTSAAAAEAHIENGIFLNSSAQNGSANILVTGGNDIYIENITMNNPGTAQPTAGIEIQNCGDLNLTNVDIINCGGDLLINPGNGQEVDSVWATQCAFDTAIAGIVIDPSGSGAVQRCRFVGCWTSSHSQEGILIENSGTGPVDGIEFIGHHCFNNTVNGMVIQPGVSNVRVEGGAFSGNGGAGISVAAGVSNFSITDANCGYGFGWNGNDYGIIVNTGTSDLYVILGNTCLGNVTAGISNGGSGGSTVVANNLT